MSTTPRLSPSMAQPWVDRYESMMQREVPHRRETLAEVAARCRELATGSELHSILELGAGPGTLARRLADQHPTATVVAVDADPVLLGLARALRHPRVRLVHARIGAPEWRARLRLEGPVDVAVAVAVVHYLSDEQARRWYADLAHLLAGQGSLVLADSFVQAPPYATSPPHAGPVTTTDPATETWQQWWAAADAEPCLRALREVDDTFGPSCDGDERLEAHDHRRWLHEAGFSRVKETWRRGSHAVLLATRR